VRGNKGFLQLRKLEAARDIASQLATSGNRVMLDSASLLLNGMLYRRFRRHITGVFTLAVCSYRRFGYKGVKKIIYSRQCILYFDISAKSLIILIAFAVAQVAQSLHHSHETANGAI